MTASSPEPREFVGLRISPQGVEWADQVALDESGVTGTIITRSHVIRAALAVARLHDKELRALLRKEAPTRKHR